MDEWITALEQMTLRIVDHLEELTSEELLVFVDDRERIIEQIRQVAATEAERVKYKPRMDNLRKHDAVIVEKMNRQKEEAREGIDKISTARVQRNAYDLVYTPDGVYFDKKK